MNLDKISIKARPRTPWQAVDLGFVLARHWWRPLFLSWLIPPLLLFIVCSLIFMDSPWIAIIVVWWLKPFWDRAPLYIASKALFGEQVTVMQTLKQLPALYRKDFIPWLTWRRLSSARSFDMPVTILESLTGKRRSARLQVLHYTSGSAASWLTIVCVHLEAIISMGIMGAVFWMMPEQLDFDWLGFFFAEQILPLHINNFLTFVAMALVAPFYTMAGFALYISRRIDLEAWDIEIRFRHMASNKQQGHGLLVSLVFVFGLALSTLLPQEALAQDQLSIEKQEASLTIEHILEGEQFHLKRDVSGWRLKEWESEEERNKKLPDWIISIIEFLEKYFGPFESAKSFFEGAARVLEFALWVVATSLLIYFFYRYREQLKTLINGEIRNKDDADKPVPEVLFGLDVRRESLPDDVPAQVQQLWSGGETRAALSLLYRATLSSLIHHYNFSFADGDTEGECVAIVRCHGDERLSDYTQQVSWCWQQLAYGHHLPETESVNRLCDQWGQVFQHEQ